MLQDSGDLIARANPFDLSDVALRFTPNGGGYDLTRADGAFRSRLGTRLVLEDDDSSAFDVPFTFTFYGAAQPRGFVNSDGNITFGEGDSASTDRSVTRFLAGAPRLSPFFADLDPTTGSGRVFLATGPDGGHRDVVQRARLRPHRHGDGADDDAAHGRGRSAISAPRGPERRRRRPVARPDGCVHRSRSERALRAAPRPRRPWASASRRTPTSTWSPSRASSIRRIRTATTSSSCGPIPAS